MYEQSLTESPLPATDGVGSTWGPDVIRLRLGVLISRYLREGSAELAQLVVAHMEALCQDPNLRDPDLFCGYRRLIRHWRWLSAQ